MSINAIGYSIGKLIFSWKGGGLSFVKVDIWLIFTFCDALGSSCI